MEIRERSHFSYPFKIDGRGRTVAVEEEQHIHQLIEQVLFTSPGERLNRPTFGSGIYQLIFEPNSNEVVSATSYLVQGSLQQWLGDLIQVQSVEVENQDSILRISVNYTIKRNQESQSAVFVKEVS